MKFELYNEVDKGPVVRWFANQMVGISSWLLKVSSPYANMYTAVWDEYEDEDLSVPHNQMVFFEDYEPLPQFQYLTDDLI